MACYSPITGWRSRFTNDSGKRSIVFSAADGFLDQEYKLPCGRCTGCRLDYSRSWAVRCMHEAQLYSANSFITLTYAPEHLPYDKSVCKKEIQKFIKRLRKNTGKTFRYFACGEYGEKNYRPHYHAILFGLDFPDMYPHGLSNDRVIYRSPLLEKCWKKGHCSIGTVEFDSCAYVARYCMKKRKGPADTVDPKTGKTNEEHYMLVDPATGELFRLEPEFCLMSRMPGIGRDWYSKYNTDLNKGFLTINGSKMSIPKYYDNLIEKDDPKLSLHIKKIRRRLAIKNHSENDSKRLSDMEEVKKAQLGYLVRDLEEL